MSPPAEGRLAVARRLSARIQELGAPLDSLFTYEEISAAANGYGLFEHVEAAAYERGFQDGAQTPRPAIIHHPV